MTMTPTERMALASERLDAWLDSFDKLDSPIEGALDDLNGWIEEAKCVANHECADGKADCVDCLKNTISGISQAYGHVWKLWTERA